MAMFSQTELYLMIGVVSVLLFGITILTILDIRDYLKSRKTVIVEEDSLEEETLEPITVTETEDEKVAVETKNEEVYLEDMEDEKIEINPIVEEEEEVYVPKVEIDTPKVEVEVPKVEVEIPKVEVKPEKKKLDAYQEYEDMEINLPNEKDDITNFEAEQERTAIISLDELMKRSDELYNDNEVVQYDDGNEPISIDEVIKMFKRDDDKKETVVTKVEEEVEEKVPYAKKETIPFISSVYGIEKENNALEFENTATYEKLDRAKYNDFIAQLKEMNENK